MKNIALIAAFLILLAACEEEESNPTGGLGEAKNIVSGSAGSSFDVTLRFKRENERGQSIGMEYWCVIRVELL